MYFRSTDTRVSQDKRRKRNMIINNKEYIRLFSCLSSSEENNTLKRPTAFSIVSEDCLYHEFLNQTQDNMSISSSLIRNKVKINST